MKILPDISLGKKHTFKLKVWIYPYLDHEDLKTENLHIRRDLYWWSPTIENRHIPGDERFPSSLAMHCATLRLLWDFLYDRFILHFISRFSQNLAQPSPQTFWQWQLYCIGTINGYSGLWRRQTYNYTSELLLLLLSCLTRYSHNMLGW